MASFVNKGRTVNLRLSGARPDSERRVSCSMAPGLIGCHPILVIAVLINLTAGPLREMPDLPKSISYEKKMRFTALGSYFLGQPLARENEGADLRLLLR
jgi:hypothetical protein